MLGLVVGVVVDRVDFFLVLGGCSSWRSAAISLVVFVEALRLATVFLDDAGVVAVVGSVEDVGETVGTAVVRCRVLGPEDEGMCAGVVAVFVTAAGAAAGALLVFTVATADAEAAAAAPLDAAARVPRVRAMRRIVLVVVVIPEFPTLDPRMNRTVE